MAGNSWEPKSRLEGRLPRRRLLYATGAGSALLLAGCGKTKGSGPTSQSNAGVAGKPKSGGKLTMPVTTDPYDFDMSYQGKSTSNDIAIAMTYNSLLGFKAGPAVPQDQIILQPELAERWESPDAQTYTFHLRKGVKFADLPPVNGRELTSADVKWSYEYWSRTGDFKNKKLPVAQFDWIFEGMSALETPDDATIVVTFDKPFAPFINYAAWDWNPVVAHEIFDQDGSLKNHVAGTGAYQLDSASSQHGSHWNWKKNPGYWESGKPYIDEVDWLVLADAPSTYAAFQTKQIDTVGSEIFADSQTIKADSPGAVAKDTVTAHKYMYMNNAKPPLDDMRVRRALSLATDHAELIKVLTGGKGLWSLAGALPDTFTQAEIAQIAQYDPGQAKQLLGAAGHASGLDLDIDVDTGAETVTEQLLQAQWKKAGINLAIKAFDSAVASKRRKSGQFTLTTAPKALVPDIDTFLYAVFAPDSKANYAGVNDPALTKLLFAQRGEPDPAKRRDIVRQAVRLIYDNAYSLSLYFIVRTDFWFPYLKNFIPYVSGQDWPMENSWLEK